MSWHACSACSAWHASVPFAPFVRECVRRHGRAYTCAAGPLVLAGHDDQLRLDASLSRDPELRGIDRTGMSFRWHCSLRDGMPCLSVLDGVPLSFAELPTMADVDEIEQWEALCASDPRWEKR